MIPVHALNIRWKWNWLYPAAAARSFRLGGWAERSISRQARRTVSLKPSCWSGADRAASPVANADADSVVVTALPLLTCLPRGLRRAA